MILFPDPCFAANFRSDFAVCFWFDGSEGRESGCLFGVLVSREFELSDGSIGFIGIKGFSTCFGGRDGVSFGYFYYFFYCFFFIIFIILVLGFGNGISNWDLLAFYH